MLSMHNGFSITFFYILDHFKTDCLLKRARYNFPGLFVVIIVQFGQRNIDIANETGNLSLLMGSRKLVSFIFLF